MIKLLILLLIIINIRKIIFRTNGKNRIFSLNFVILIFDFYI